MKQLILFVLTAYCFMACNQAGDQNAPATGDSLANKVQADTVKSYVHRFADTSLEDRITGALMNLPFVIKSSKYIDSISNHKHSIAFMLDEPDAPGADVPVQAGYNGNERFETYYRFFVNPKTLEIKVYDPVEDKKLTVKEYLKTQQ